MIRVNEKYVIIAGALDYTACVDTGRTKINEKTGKEEMVTKFIGYYSTIGGCIKGIAQYDVLEKVRSTDMSLEEAIKEIKKTNKYLTDCFNDLEFNL